jgi:hypothetical protein
MKVGFLICGTHKGGTTALDASLRKHPGIQMARHKEVHFFDNDRRFRDGLQDYESYHAFFVPVRENAVLGEATPNYMYHADAPRRIKDYNQAMKIILLLRNPITRAYSHWNMERHHRVEPRPFLEAVQCELAAREQPAAKRDWRLTYLSRGFYSGQIRRFWELFPREQVLILRFDQLRRDPDRIVGEIFSFLGVEPVPLKVPDAHSLPYVSELGAVELELLRSVFATEIRELEHMLSWDCADWLR